VATFVIFIAFAWIVLAKFILTFLIRKMAGFDKLICEAKVIFTLQIKKIKAMLPDNKILERKKKTRLILKQGNENIALTVADIALFDTRLRSVFVIDKCSKEYQLNKSLSEIQECLDENIFFRANRQQLININYIRCFKTHEKVKLIVELNLVHVHIPIIISQETAPLFKKWLTES